MVLDGSQCFSGLQGCLNLLVLVKIWSVHGFQGLEMVTSGFYGYHGYLWLAQAVHGLQGLKMVTSGFYGYHGYLWLIVHCA